MAFTATVNLEKEGCFVEPVHESQDGYSLTISAIWIFLDLIVLFFFTFHTKLFATCSSHLVGATPSAFVVRLG